MFQNFVMWMHEPGKWNDAVVLCAVIMVVCIICMLVEDRLENRKAQMRGGIKRRESN